MLNVAIVEDEDKSADLLESYLNRYSQENGTVFSIKKYTNAVNFLNDYKPVHNIILMDIDMPGLNGMDASFQLRKLDHTVTLIFVTNMAQLAIKGYEVNALDFIVKPVSYPNFTMKIERAIRVEKSKISEREVLTLNTSFGTKVIEIRELKYLEVIKHRVIFHTERGTTEVQGSLKDFENRLEGMNFARCHNCYLVNLNHVTEISDDSVLLGNESIQLSRRKRQAFLDDFTKFLGGR